MMAGRMAQRGIEFDREAVAWVRVSKSAVTAMATAPTSEMYTRLEG